MGAFASKRDKTDSHKKPRNSTTPSNPTTSSTGANNTSSSSSSSSSSGPVAKNSLSVLLLGTGETGKSTLFKQLELINGVGIIKDNERSMWAALIHGNVISDMKTLIGIVEETDNQEVSDEMHELIQEILELPDQSVMINAELCEKLKKLWNYEVIKHAYDNRDQALDSAEYLYNNIDRIAQPDYSPTVDDVLHCRVKTLGVHHVELIMDGNFKFKLIDVGGQRSERRKWLELMSEVDAVIFMTSLAEFDQECYEEKGFKRIVESLETFDKVINNKLFQKVPFILMLNKRDLFERKIEKKSFKKYFPNYAGDEKNAQQCIDFISKMFLEKCKERSTDTILVQPHCAINKEETEQMLQHAKSFVISQYSKKK